MSDPASQTEPPQSPCVNICVMHKRAGLCVGCHRSLDEIAAWGALSPEARRRIMADLPARKAAMRKGRG